MSRLIPGKLENYEIKKHLQEFHYPDGYSPAEALIIDIINQFWFHDYYNSFISDPIFLDFLTTFLSLRKPKQFNRYSFYEFFVETVLKRCKPNELDFFDKLQRIALIFELAQTSSMHPEDFNKILLEIRDKKQIFNENWFLENHLGKREKDEKGHVTFMFEHHTITEFLVAKLIVSSKNPEVLLEKLAVIDQEGVIALKPSWYGVLRFLLESQTSESILIWLTVFLETHKENLDEHLSDLITSANSSVPRKLQTRIFDLIYDFYFCRLMWIPTWSAQGLAKFIDKTRYEKFKNDLKTTKSKTETFVHQGNITYIVEVLLETKNPLIKPDKEFWKEKLISFAHSENGVLRRHSLAALAKFHEPDLIDKVSENLTSTDTLVKDAFIQFCIETSPNSTKTIDFLIKGYKSGSTIYSRHGIYAIEAKEGIKYFLKKISADEPFLRQWLHDESIFDRDDAGDRQLINHVSRVADKSIVALLKKIIKTVVAAEDIYQESRSDFLKEVVKIIEINDKNYLFELLKQINTQSNQSAIDRLMYEYSFILYSLINEDNLDNYFEFVDKLDEPIKNRAYAIAEQLKYSEKQKSVYDEAVKNGKLQPSSLSEPEFIKSTNGNSDKIYSDFLLGIKSHNPEIFRYFLQNKKEIEGKWDVQIEKNFIEIAIEIIDKISPRKFEVSIADKTNGSRQFKWSAPASYYGELLKIINVYAPQKIKEHKQDIIDFIPYAFSQEMSQILNLILKISDEELIFVNTAMQDKSKDIRYLAPSSYIYIIGEYIKRGCNLQSAKSVLTSFIDDTYIINSDKTSAIETLGLLIKNNDTSTKKFLLELFEKQATEDEIKIAHSANALLIKVYKDKASIQWRIDKLKDPIKFSEESRYEVHTVGPIEHELDSMEFARPLIDLHDKKCLPYFFDLLEHSFKVLQKDRDKEFWEYVNYLWRITIAFVDKLKDDKSFTPLLELEKWVSKYEAQEKSNWLTYRLIELRRNYIDFIGKQEGKENK